MRQVGTLPDESQAKRLVDHLVSQDIEAEARAEAQGWGIWIHREDQMTQGQALFKEFLNQPDDPRFEDSTRIARAKRREADRQDREHQRKTVVLDGQLNTVSPRRCPVTHILIGVSVAVAILTRFGGDINNVQMFLFSPSRDVPQVVRYQNEETGQTINLRSTVPQSQGLEPLQHGQLWRLWTPMFVHFGFRHLIFNMLALYWFGGMIELRKSSRVLALLVLASAPASFAVEYFWDVYQQGSEVFLAVGGMSGVNYALFGYAWMKSDYEPESHLQISSSTVGLMLFWLVLCMTGAMGNVANAAHLSGLVFGMLVALTPHLRNSLR